MPKPDDVGVGTAVCLLDSNLNMLMIERKGAHGAGTLSWPGGWVDRSDESILGAIARETAEEVGLVLNNAHQVIATTHDSPDIAARSVTVCFVSFDFQWSGTPTNLEPDKVERLLWVPVYEDPPGPTFGAIDAALVAIRAYINEGV